MEPRDNVWERLAREDAKHYILTDRPEYTDPEDQAYFVASGDQVVDELLAATDAYRAGSGRAIEIGCGVGRLAIPVARRFSEVRAVDVAPTMLERLVENCRHAGVTNVFPFLPHEAWDAEPADLIYSRLVFQHIPDIDVIRGYVERIARCLRPDAVASLQFDTRPRTLSYRLRNRLPDRLLPRDQRRGIRRIRRDREGLLALFRGAGLEPVAEDGAGTELDVFLLRPRA